MKIENSDKLCTGIAEHVVALKDSHLTMAPMAAWAAPHQKRNDLESWEVGHNDVARDQTAAKTFSISNLGGLLGFQFILPKAC